mmetsp:Transcript_6930/g.20747  ORF Transcript_6930/g.20747 Transcript_6930/m.20747 type:complete len:431 (-) Transcript_6930:311-1603(-)
MFLVRFLCQPSTFTANLVLFFLQQKFYGEASCNSWPRIYDQHSCREFFDCTVSTIVSKIDGTIDRSFLADVDVEKIGHTPLWLRVSDGKLYCVRHQKVNSKKLRLKAYRSMHYVNRLIRILDDVKLTLPDETEWWSHQSDWVKVPEGSDMPPVFAISGADEYMDIPGIPFMSFSDKLSIWENRAFDEMYRAGAIRPWSERNQRAFFRGSLSDCSESIQKHDGNLNFCARAKVIYEAVKSKHPLLGGIFSISDFEQAGLNTVCKECIQRAKFGTSYLEDLTQNKYLINFPGAGNWSRRLSILLRAGGLVLQSESPGYQFYEVLMKPGVHYIPFDAQVGQPGGGNLLSRLVWAQENDRVVEEIVKRSQSFGAVCLKQSSIDYFLSTLMKKYASRLTGKSLEMPLIDLSTCVKRDKHTSIGRRCASEIQKCWR